MSRLNGCDRRISNGCGAVVWKTVLRGRNNNLKMVIMFTIMVKELILMVVDNYGNSSGGDGGISYVRGE